VFDVRQQNVNIRRDFINDPEMDWGHHKHRENNHRLSGVTNDDRVAELIEMVAAHNVGSAAVPFDCIITPIINGSPDYLEWIQIQTMKKDPSLAYYNIKPEDEIHGLDNAIGQIGHVADKAHSTSTIVPNQEHIQVKTESTFADGEEDEESGADSETLE
jgi:hypothetical protein